MNPILNNGFVSPYIHFQFLNGNSIDTIPPRYFISFNQKRSIKKACAFTLTIMYAPGNFGESTASLIHQLILSNSGKDVLYEYGYKVPGGNIVTQNQMYVGIFTKYTESINEGFLTYTISGVSHAVESSSPEVNISNYINKLLNENQNKKPSSVLKDLIYGYNGADEPIIQQFFKDFTINIDNTDETLAAWSYKDLPQVNVSLHDLIMGKKETDGTTIVSGIVPLGIKSYTPMQAVSSGLLSSSSFYSANAYYTLSSHGVSSQAAQYKNGYNNFKNVSKTNFVAFFDNVLTGSSKGSFNYVPQLGRDTNSIFNYNFGNNFLNSDVLSFNADVDWTSAIVSIPAINSTRTSIDANGQNIGSNFITNNVPHFNKTIYNTPSGFDTSAFITSATLANALNFPFQATMTVIGQLDCNKLMDRITVNVFVNGLEHVGLSGLYTILEVEDNLSESGFTTTFQLLKITKQDASSGLPDFYTNDKNGVAYKNQQAFENDYK